MNKEDRVEILFEDIKSENQRIFEVLDGLRAVPRRLGHLEEKVDDIYGTMQILAPVVKEHSQRINRLEQTVFPQAN